MRDDERDKGRKWPVIFSSPEKGNVPFSISPAWTISVADEENSPFVDSLPLIVSDTVEFINVGCNVGEEDMEIGLV